VGLYIGSKAIAAAEAHRTASGDLMIDRFGISDTPPGTIDDNGIVAIDAASRAVHDLFVASKIRPKAATLVISGNNIVTRLLTLPSLPRNEMLEVLKGEMENYAVLSGDEPVLDFQVVNQNANEQKWKYWLWLHQKD